MIELSVNHDVLKATQQDGNSPASIAIRGRVQIGAGEESIRNDFLASKPWSATRPRTLVVACSDGRLQETVDEFLEQHLGVVDYDRLYAPGGPAALATGGYEILRADQFRREFAFLMNAHGTEEVILLFHGATNDGPDLGVCAHYKRLMPRATRAQIALQQEQDAAEVVRQAFVGLAHVRLRIYRAEVNSDNLVRFVNLLSD